MKTIHTYHFFFALCIAFTFQFIQAKDEAEPGKCPVTVLNIDVHGLDYTPEQLGNLVRLELEKLDTFEVMDRYDVAYLVKKNNLDISNCYGKIGLVEVGKSLNSQKMLSGSADVYGETIILSFRLVDVSKSVIEKSYVQEFLNYPKELQAMIRVSLQELFGVPVDKNIKSQLTKPNSFESTVNNPDATRLNLSGPRMGAAFFTGEYKKILEAPKGAGGFDMYPVMYQFGYQFEVMYLNEGNFQALFEFIPMFTGLDQGVLRPSFTLMNGVRHNISGWELAVGPNFSVAKKAQVYNDGVSWKLANEWKEDFQNPYNVVSRHDSRGDYELSTSFVIAVGKTIKSGKLNFPVNVYCIPGRDGLQFGVSVGYNAKNVK